MKRFVRGIAATCIVVVGLTGCGGQSGGNQTSSSNSGGNQATAGDASGKPLSFRVTTVNFGMTPTDTVIQNEWQKICEEQMGRKLDIKWEYITMGDYKEKQQVILAGGDLPDILSIFQLSSSDLMKYGKQGVFEELTQHMDKLPNYSKIVETDEYAKDKIYSDEGKTYTFYNAQYYPDGNKGILAAAGVRMDLLREVGINEVPSTLDELYLAAKALKEKYPDKYPMILHEEWQAIENTVCKAYRTDAGMYYNGTEYVYGPLEDNYKESLKYMNKIYSEGLISPDYITHTAEQGQAAVANGEAMIIPSIWDGYPAQWVTEYPDQEWVLVPYISQEKGDDSWEFFQFPCSEWNLTTGYSAAVSSKSKVKDEMLQLMDIQYSPEIIELMTWGIEGETFEIGADGEKSIMDKFKEDANLLVELGHPVSGKRRAGIFPVPQDQLIYREFAPSGRVYNGSEVIDRKTYDFVVESANDSNIAPMYNITTPTLTSDESERYANIMTAVQTYVKEARIKFIKGERSFDEWDKYIEEVNKMGDIKAALDIYNAKIK